MHKTFFCRWVKNVLRHFNLLWKHIAEIIYQTSRRNRLISQGCVKLFERHELCNKNKNDLIFVRNFFFFTNCTVSMLFNPYLGQVGVISKSTSSVVFENNSFLEDDSDPFWLTFYQINLFKLFNNIRFICCPNFSTIYRLDKHFREIYHSMGFQIQVDYTQIVHQRHIRHCQTSMMEIIYENSKRLIVIDLFRVKIFILDVWQRAKYTFGSYLDYTYWLIKCLRFVSEEGL